MSYWCHFKNKIYIIFYKNYNGFKEHDSNLTMEFIFWLQANECIALKIAVLKTKRIQIGIILNQSQRSGQIVSVFLTRFVISNHEKKQNGPRNEEEN